MVKLEMFLSCASALIHTIARIDLETRLALSDRGRAIAEVLPLLRA